MNLLTCQDFEHTSRGFIVFVYVCERTLWLQPSDLLILLLHTMPTIKPKKKAPCKKDPDEIEDPSSEEDTDDIEFRFTASPGWLKKFQQRCDVGHLKMKGEKGSAHYESVGEWIDDWFKFLNLSYVQQHHKTLRQVLKIIVNFDECGFQYKSLPQNSYVSRDQEIRAKKPIRARITGLFGATADGHRFKPLIIGKARRPRAFQHLSKDLSELPVYYYL